MYIFDSSTGLLLKSLYEWNNGSSNVESNRILRGLEMFASGMIFMSFNEGDYSYIAYYDYTTLFKTYVKRIGSAS